MIREWFQRIFRANAVWMEQEAVNDAVLRCFLLDPSYDFDYDQIDVVQSSSNRNEFIDEARETMLRNMPYFTKTAIYLKEHADLSLEEIAKDCHVVREYVEALAQIRERLLKEDDEEDLL